MNRIVLDTNSLIQCISPKAGTVRFGIAFWMERISYAFLMKFLMNMRKF